MANGLITGPLQLEFEQQSVVFGIFNDQDLQSAVHNFVFSVIEFILVN